MADQKFSVPLKNFQISNPVVAMTELELSDMYINPSNEMLENLFPIKGKQSLRTWGRSKGEHANLDPHWMRIKRGTPLHTDPLYKRYSHHFVLKGESYGLRGHDKKETKIGRGTVYVLDVHSPHQVTYHDEDNIWYISVSLDHETILPFEQVIPILINYALTEPFVKAS